MREARIPTATRHTPKALVLFLLSCWQTSALVAMQQEVANDGAQVELFRQLQVAAPSISIVSELLQSGANTSSRNHLGQTPVEIAVHACIEASKDSQAEASWIAILQLFLQQGADANVTSATGQSILLEIAPRPNSEKVIGILAQAGASLEPRESNPAYLNYTPIMLAADSGQFAAVELLLQLGANANPKNCKDKHTLLMLLSKISCAANGYCVSRLLASSASSTDGAVCPEHEQMFASPSLIEIIVKSGADPNARDSGLLGWTPLMWAVRNGARADFLEALVKAGADPNLRDISGNTALMWAASGRTSPEIITALVKAGAKIELENEDGLSALEWAVFSNTNSSVVRTLLDFTTKSSTSKLDVNALLMSAALSNPTAEVCRLLLDEGASAKYSTKEGITALMRAAAFNSAAEVVKELIARGAEVNAQTNWNDDDQGMSPLMFASRYSKNPEIVSVLLLAGADPKLTTAKGETALQLAKYNQLLRKSDVYWTLHDATYK